MELGVFTEVGDNCGLVFHPGEARTLTRLIYRCVFFCSVSSSVALDWIRARPLGDDAMQTADAATRRGQRRFHLQMFFRAHQFPFQTNLQPHWNQQVSLNSNLFYGIDLIGSSQIGRYNLGSAALVKIVDPDEQTNPGKCVQEPPESEKLNNCSTKLKGDHMDYATVYVSFSR